MPVTAGRLALAGVGGLFLWSGLRGASVLGSIRDAINGQPLTGGTYPISGTPSTVTNEGGADPSGTGNTNDIANQALGYVGTPYVWGAANPPDGTDCSGLVNAIVGRNLGMGIPGYPTGKFSGHGPVTGQWYVWSGCTTVSKADAAPGDLVCWLSHMGICVGNGEMVSALNPKMGTLKTTFAGGSPVGEPMLIRRLKA